jgi:glyoxylase-like metal-dependent hydrolase (beta-lactamase superfamily II)
MTVATVLRGLGLAVFAFASISAADGETLDTGSLRLIEIIDGIYAVEPNFAGANGAVILNETGNIVVDTHGTPVTARALIKAVSDISDAPIRYVVNTHWHVDHHSGNEAYKAAFGSDVIFIAQDQTRKDIPTLGAEQFTQVAPFRSMPVQSAEAALAENRDSHEQSLSAEQISEIKAFRDEQAIFAAKQEYVYTLPNLTFSESITLHGDPYTVEVFYLYPGHTKSDSIVYIRDPEILIIGDLLTQPILWSWSSYPSSYVRTLSELEQLPVQKIVIGHGGPVLDGKSYLTQARQFLEAVVAHSERSFTSGTDADQAIAAAASLAEIQQFRRRFVTEEEDNMFDQMVRWTISRAYEELAE